MFVPDLLAEAAHHRVARNDAEAEACYRRILAEQPDLGARGTSADAEDPGLLTLGTG